MEQIQDHPIKDIWRVRDGLLIEIHKYKHIGKGRWYYGQLPTKVVRGCKGLKELKKSYEDLPKGTFIYGSSPVEPLTDPKLFKAEVKSSGGSIYGSLTEIQEVMNDIDIILAKYLVQLD